MRILHVDSGREWRGGQGQVLHLMAGLGSLGHEQLLAAPEGAPLLTRARAAGFSAEPLAVRGDLDARALVRLRGIVARFRPDLLHAHTAHAHAVGVAAARLAGVSRRVVTRRSELRVGRHWLSSAKYLSGVTRYIAISKSVAASLERGGVDPGRVSVVYSGVDVAGVADAGDAAARQAARRELDLGASDAVIVAVGALTPEKGHDLALMALRDLPEGVLMIVAGGGPERPRLEALAGRLGIGGRVRFAGHLDGMERLWPAFDLLLAPSRHEGLGTAVIEAMASGLPVVAARVGGLAELVEDGLSGCLVPPGEPLALARAARTLLENTDERTRLAAAARRRGREFTLERMVAGTNRVYHEVSPGRAAVAAVAAAHKEAQA